MLLPKMIKDSTTRIANDLQGKNGFGYVLYKWTSSLTCTTEFRFRSSLKRVHITL